MPPPTAACSQCLDVVFSELSNTKKLPGLVNGRPAQAETECGSHPGKGETEVREPDAGAFPGTVCSIHDRVPGESSKVGHQRVLPDFQCQGPFRWRGAEARRKRTKLTFEEAASAPRREAKAFGGKAPEPKLAARNGQAARQPP